MAIRHAFVIGAPIALVAVAIGVVSQKRTHGDVNISILREAPPIAVPAPPAAEGAFVSLTRVSDDEIASQGFSLSEPLDVRVYAVGEGTGNQMHDFGWIIDATTRQPVWQMRYEDTERAGGAIKNRMIDETITLEPGNYIAYYMTDGSHSWDDWNSSPPKYENSWGMTLFTADGIVNGDIIGEYDVGSDPAVIAQLTAISDDDSRGAPFSLETETEIRIYAIGEGESGDMYDYAWIEDAKTGQQIWTMRHPDTEHAGGARKNRAFNSIIKLPAGDYLLRYQADGSHSLESWNMAPPHDPFAYGVTLLRVDR